MVLILLGVIAFTIDISTAISWDGRKDVEVRFSDELLKEKVKVIRYDNMPYEYLADEVRIHNNIIMDKTFTSMLSTPNSKDNKTFFVSRGSGQYSYLFNIEDYEYWYDGFFAEVESDKGELFYALGQMANRDSKPYVVLRKLNPHQVP